MKRKVVLWGENAANEKILLALELLEKDNKVNIYTFPHAIVTEDFSKKMHDEWREDKEVSFPDGVLKIERPLTMSDSLLPDDIKVDRPDIITMAQAEWHVIVLSNKLYDTYRAELDEIKAKVDSMSEYDDKVWDSMVEFWAKISDQVKERVIFREHASILKDRTNILFGKLKDLKKEIQKQYEVASKEIATKFFAEIEIIEQKINDGLGLRPLFDQLKNMQASFKDADMTRKDKDKVYKKIDDTFKSLKSQKSGDNSGGGPNRGSNSGNNGNKAGGALQSRYDGLLGAIRKMQQTVNLDNQEIAFQLKRIDQTDGQLEMQIRQAKMKMIQERLKSKQEKLDDMLKTKVELENRMKADEFKKAKQVEEVKVKEKIASDIAQAKEARNPIMDKLESAAVAITASIQSKNNKKETANDLPVEDHGAKQDEPSLFETISSIVSETYEDVVDTMKAVAEVVENRLENTMDKLEDKAEDVMDKVKEKAEVAMDRAEDLMDKVEDKAEDVMDKVKEGAGIVKDRAEEALDKVKDKVEIAKDKAEDVIDHLKEKAGVAMDKAEEALEKVKDKVEIAKDKAEEELDKAKDNAEVAKDNAEVTVEKAENLIGKVEDKIAEVADKVEDKVEDDINSVKSTVKKEEE